ncbi:hypothetical protein ZHAS_00020507 [Anopheles sinensis]|uniref:Uncharacterized protein n=1 Tax=Anopheles sinensis TaxID=74873 RepID=A0A084WQ15_ANOSI|nr:hypothetical protein ZHAS_00020507 [Anopheles sinensis]
MQLLLFVWHAEVTSIQSTDPQSIICNMRLEDAVQPAEDDDEMPPCWRNADQFCSQPRRLRGVVGEVFFRYPPGGNLFPSSSRTVIGDRLVGHSGNLRSGRTPFDGKSIMVQRSEGGSQPPADGNL